LDAAHPPVGSGDLPRQPYAIKPGKGARSDEALRRKRQHPSRAVPITERGAQLLEIGSRPSFVDLVLSRDLGGDARGAAALDQRSKIRRPV